MTANRERDVIKYESIVEDLNTCIDEKEAMINSFQSATRASKGNLQKVLQCIVYSV